MLLSVKLIPIFFSLNMKFLSVCYFINGIVVSIVLVNKSLKNKDYAFNIN